MKRECFTLAANGPSTPWTVEPAREVAYPRAVAAAGIVSSRHPVIDHSGASVSPKRINACCHPRSSEPRRRASTTLLERLLLSPPAQTDSHTSSKCQGKSRRTTPLWRPFPRTVPRSRRSFVRERQASHAPGTGLLRPFWMCRFWRRAMCPPRATHLPFLAAVINTAAPWRKTLQGRMKAVQRW
jgi:hypothetical protein